MLKLKLNDVGEHCIMLGLGEELGKKVARFPQPLTALANPNIKAVFWLRLVFLKHQADLIQYLGHSEEMHESVLKDEDPTLCILFAISFCTALIARPKMKNSLKAVTLKF